MCTRVKLHFTSRKLTHHLRKLATNYVSKALKSDLRFSFLPECGIKKSTGIQLCPLSCLLGMTSFLQLSFWVSFWVFWQGRRAPGRRRGTGWQEERNPSVVRCAFVHKYFKNLLYGTGGESRLCPRTADPRSESRDWGSEGLRSAGERDAGCEGGVLRHLLSLVTWHRTQSPFRKLTDPSCCKRSDLDRRGMEPWSWGAVRGGKLGREQERERDSQGHRDTETGNGERDRERRRGLGGWRGEWLRTWRGERQGGDLRRTECRSRWRQEGEMKELGLWTPSFVPAPPRPPSPLCPLYSSSWHTPCLLSRPAFCACWSGLSQVLFPMPGHQSLI